MKIINKTLIKEAITSLDSSISHLLFEIKDNEKTIYEITMTVHDKRYHLAFFEDREKAEHFIDVLVEKKLTYEKLALLIKEASFLMRTYRIIEEDTTAEQAV